MGYVRLKPDLNLQIAKRFGGKATRPHALKVEAKAKALASARAVNSSVADRIEFSTHAHGIHSSVIVRVIGLNGVQIASLLEFGYFNNWWENKYGEHDFRAHMQGKYIMSEAKYG